MSSFFQKMLVFSAVVYLNLVLFLSNVYDSEIALLYNSFLFVLVPSMLSIELTGCVSSMLKQISAYVTLALSHGIPPPCRTVFSHRIRHVLLTISAVNANNTTLQAKRILAITVFANIFFTVQIIIQGIYLTLPSGSTLFYYQLSFSLSKQITGTLSIFILYLWHTNQNLEYFMSNSIYWDLFVGTKYGSEVTFFLLHDVLAI